MDNQRIRNLNWKFGIINRKIKIRILSLLNNPDQDKWHTHSASFEHILQGEILRILCFLIKYNHHALLPLFNLHLMHNLIGALKSPLKLTKMEFCQKIKKWYHLSYVDDIKGNINYREIPCGNSEFSTFLRGRHLFLIYMVTLNFQLFHEVDKMLSSLLN